MKIEGLPCISQAGRYEKHVDIGFRGNMGRGAGIGDNGGRSQSVLVFLSRFTPIACSIYFNQHSPSDL